MQKRNLRSNKLEKKGPTLKRRQGTTNIRSMNNFQSIDKIPNDNLYKNDNLYSIKKNFEFPKAQEDSFHLFFHYQFRIKEVKGILILFYLRFITARIYRMLDFFSFFKIFNFKNIFHIISFAGSFILAKEENLKQNINSVIIYYIFLINQCMHAYTIYYQVDPKYEHYLALTSELLYNFCFLFFLNAKLKHTIIPQLVITLTYFHTIQRFPGLELTFYIAIGPVFSLLLYILLKKSIREIWALYDSFKRSYYNINQGLLESDPNPIFIITKEKNVLYRNTVASNLINNITETIVSPRKMQRSKDDRFNTMNFLDIVHPNLKELFQKLLDDVMEDENVSSFNFPLCKVNNIKQNLSNAYDISDENNYLHFIWYKIIICKTDWKGKTAFYVSFYPCEDIFLNEIFYKYTKRFSQKIERVISNSDIICMALINKKDKKENNNDSLSSSILSDNKNSDIEDSENRKSKKLPLKKNIYQLLIENADNIELNNTILFFFKNQVELLYDYSLTIELYFNMLYKRRNFKECFDNLKPTVKKKIKLRELKAYYSEYFYDFIKEHKYKLEFKRDDEKSIFDVYVEENYLRIIIFNIIVFMVCYLDDKTEPTGENRKEIVIKIMPELKDEASVTPDSATGGEEKYDKTPKGFSESEKSVKKGELSVVFESFSSKGDLNKIQELLNQRNKCGCHLKSEIIKLNYLDIGILTVNYLLENYYKTKLEMSNKEGEQVIQFRLPCDLELLTGSSNSRRFNQTNETPESNSFFTSPLIVSKKNINKPTNFYNYNPNYNKKVLNIFYGIEKSPDIRSRHKRANPSFSRLHELGDNGRRCSRHLSQNLDRYIQQYTTNENKNESEHNDANDNIIYLYNVGEDNKSSKKSSRKLLNHFSFKQTDFSFDSVDGSFKSNRVENEEKNAEEVKNNKNDEIIANIEEKDEKKNSIESKVLIIETSNNKDLITFLNMENKGEYELKIITDVTEVENELKNNNGICEYKVLLVNMGNNKEIKYAENVCEKKGETLIYGYHFGAHTRSKEKNNVKFDKRFDLSFSYEGIVYALKQTFINNTSIIK